MTRRLLALGECMVELAPAENDLFAVGYAGDTFNTAYYARRVSDPSALKVGYLSAVGDDELSERMANFMRDKGVEPELAVIPGATVGLYMIFLKDGERSFQYWRSQSAARQLVKGLDRLDGLAAGDFAYFSGITLAILSEEDRVALLEALQAAGKRGVRIVFDPNLRPRLWNSADEMREGIMAGAAICDLVLPSYEDEADWFSDADKKATAQRYLDAGAKLAIVKDGPGSVLIEGQGVDGSTVHPKPVLTIVDTTAAGDAFNGGVLAALAVGYPLEEAVKLGCAVAGEVVTRRGALVPISTTLMQSEVG